MERLSNEGGESAQSTPEQREGLLINTIVIPADQEQPLRQQQLDAASLDEYGQLLGGGIEAVGLEHPDTSMYLNHEGKVLGLPVNLRATLLLWAHQKRVRFEEVIVGDAFLTGPVNHRGHDTDVSDELTRVLFEPGPLRVALRVSGDPGWYGNELRFDDWLAAYSYALNLARRWTVVEDMKLVPAA